MQQHTPWLAANRYEVGEVVGRGGYGMVCRGVDRKTGRSVALKMLSPEAGRDPDVVERMLREQQALVALSGTCAVTAIDLCRLESGAPCLVMEWLDGCDLEQQLTTWEDAGERGSDAQLLAMLKPLAQTLERAHQIGIVHRDIKPANIFLTSGSGVRLLDFGLSRMKSAAPLTAVGMVMGSPSYIAPETWRGNSATLDGRADFFALGVIVFRWLTGSLPFDAPDLIGKMMAVTSGPRPSAVALRPELPPTIDRWLSRALAVEPSNRFSNGDDFVAALEAALRGEAWVSSNADASGVRSVAAAPTSAAPEPVRKNALASAWQAAASLLKRFTAPRERETPTTAGAAAATPAATATATPAATAAATATAAPAAAAAEQPEAIATVNRPTLWLDSSELEDIRLSPAAAAQPVAKPRAKRKAAAKPKAKRAPKTKAAPQAKPPKKRKARKA